MDGERSGGGPARLSKELGLFDVYAISTGAMFSSGFFLLPGLAAAETGPSVVLAYLLAGIFIVPAMLSGAELSTAMPRAGGAYYFLDRALGPMVGTVGGLGAWFALVLKSAFALVGMGAYLALVADVPIKPVAVALTVVFAVLNAVGAKETSRLQRILVTALVGILILFILQGIAWIGAEPRGVGERMTPFLAFGAEGLVATVGLVFVSYAGLTKVCSVAEEIRRPERNIALGMGLSLVTATVIYVVGVLVMVAAVEPSGLRSDLTPVATAAREIFACAGVLSASRYPLAMARDRLLPGPLAELGRHGTPKLSIFITAGVIAASILVLDIQGLAKLASAFGLLLFALLNLAVIVMRESGIETYDPGFRSPLYPWMQVAGMLIPLWLIAGMGQMALLFTLGLVGVCLVWFFAYARARVVRTGAIFHAFERLGRNRFDGLERELGEIVREQELRDEDAYDLVVARARTLELPGELPLSHLLEAAAGAIAPRVGASRDRLHRLLSGPSDPGPIRVGPGVVLCHTRLPELAHPELLLVRAPAGARLPPHVEGEDGERARAIFVLVSPAEHPGRHLRLLGHLASHLDQDDFLRRWLAAPAGEGLKDLLLEEENLLSLTVSRLSATRGLTDRSIAEAELPPGTLVAVVHRDGTSLIPDGTTRLREGDRLTVIGDRSGIRTLSERYGAREPAAASAPTPRRDPAPVP